MKSKRIYESVTHEQFLQLIKSATKMTHRLSFILAYGSGLRISEITALQPEDINLKEHKIFVRQAKGGKDRVVNSPKWLKQAHISHFPLRVGERALSKAFLNHSLKAGFNPVIYVDNAKRPRYKYHFHSLRHSYATRALEKGVPVHQVQLLMGHENLATTSRYTKANPIDAINSILEAGL